MPPVPWTFDAAEARRIARAPGIDELHRLLPPRGRGPINGVILPVLHRAPILREHLLSIWLVRFRSSGSLPRS
jgi:hypothetical protein